MHKKYKISALITIMFAFFAVFGCTKDTGPKNTITRYTLKSNDTLIGSLSTAGINNNGKMEIINNLKNIFNPRKCIPGDSYEIEIGTYNNWVGFKYYPAGLTYYSVTKDLSGNITFEKKKRLTTKTTQTLITGTLMK